MDGQYDLIVIGAGSGGLAAAQRAAEYGARVVDHRVRAARRHAASTSAAYRRRSCGTRPRRPRRCTTPTATAFGSTPGGTTGHCSSSARDAYIHRLNGIYAANLAKRNVELVRGRAQLPRCDVGERRGQLRCAPRASSLRPAGGRRRPRSRARTSASPRTASLRSPSGRSAWPSSAAATSPLNSPAFSRTLGSATTLVIRGDRILRGFDSMLGEATLGLLRDAGHEHRHRRGTARARRAARTDSLSLRSRAGGAWARSTACCGRSAAAPRSRTSGSSAPACASTTHGCIATDLLPGDQRQRRIRHRRRHRARCAYTGGDCRRPAPRRSAVRRPGRTGTWITTTSRR